MTFTVFFFQAEDGIRDLVRSRGLGDVYKRQVLRRRADGYAPDGPIQIHTRLPQPGETVTTLDGATRKLEPYTCLLYTSDAADERSSVDLGGRRIIKKKKTSARVRPALE